MKSHVKGSLAVNSASKNGKNEQNILKKHLEKNFVLAIARTKWRHGRLSLAH